jgi:alginate O-acetyltransferase complex protein AlgI
MLFNSLLYLVFFAVVLCLHRLPLSWTVRKVNLLVASYLFYAAWNPPFVLLLWLSTIVDWFVAKRLGSMAGRNPWRRALLLVTLCSNLGLLSYFKYGTFLLQTFADLMHAVGVAYQPPALDVVLPVGISFYTFQTLSYTLDVYFRRARPADSFLDFALYVGFFPQLVAGPIVRATTFLPQCKHPSFVGAREFGIGASLLVFGLFEKVVLADWLLSPSADVVFDVPAAAGSLDAWMGALAFSGQIFFDFSGYSMCAIGSAMCLGFHLPRNFHSPYAATGFSDFWRRWHISLSTWLRDYLYIPLGGNRSGESQAARNVMITMLVGGLWHGASWRFVAWGGLHGLYLMVERVFRRRRAEDAPESGTLARVAGSLATFVVVTITWTFFRAHSFADAATLIRAMFVPTSGGILGAASVQTVAAVIAVTLAGQWLLRDRDLEAELERIPWWAGSLLLACAVLAILVAPGDDRAFIYFQF